MKTWQWILFSLTLLALAINILRLLWKEWKEGKQPSPDDKIYDLRWKIENAIVSDENELLFKEQLKELSNDPAIDKYKLNQLDIIFRQKYQDLHQTT